VFSSLWTSSTGQQVECFANNTTSFKNQFSNINFYQGQVVFSCLWASNYFINTMRAWSTEPLIRYLMSNWLALLAKFRRFFHTQFSYNAEQCFQIFELLIIPSASSVLCQQCYHFKKSILTLFLPVLSGVFFSWSFWLFPQQVEGLINWATHR
jgi:hypothetical protein